MITGPAKRRSYWPRQAAWLLAPPSGVITGLAKRLRHYRRRFASRANEQAAIDDDGLHFYAPFGKTIHWFDEHF